MGGTRGDKGESSLKEEGFSALARFQGCKFATWGEGFGEAAVSVVGQVHFRNQSKKNAARRAINPRPHAGGKNLKPCGKLLPLMARV